MGVMLKRGPWDEQSGVSDLDNPISGTPFDPNRRAWMRGSAGGGTSAAPASDDSGQVTGSTQPPVDTSAGTAAIQAPPGPPVTNGQPIPSAQATPTAPVTPNAPASPEDEIFNRIMTQSMDDTPSNDRINKLQGEYDARHQPQSLKRRLLGAALLAAPTAIAGAVGGQVAAGGAAEGTVEAEQTLHDRGVQQDQILRSQIEGERNRQERQYERRMSLPLTYMNMKMMRDYRQSQLGLGRDKMNMQDKLGHDRLQQGHQDLMTKLGLDANGTPIPEDQLPVASKQKILQSRAHQGLYDAQSNLAEAREELQRAQNDPDSPAFQLSLMKVKAAMAQAKAAESRAHAMGLSSAVREAQYYKSAFGTDIEGDTLPGSYSDPNTGTTLGWNAPGNPTSAIKYRGQTAQEVLGRLSTGDQAHPGVEAQINAMDDKELGLIKGHFNDWWTGKWGGDNPKISQLRTALMLSDTAMMLSHVGQSGGVEMMDHFKSLLNLGQSKANLLANLGEIKSWLGGYAQQGTPNAPSGAANPNFTPVRGAPTKLTKESASVTVKGPSRLQKTPDKLKAKPGSQGARIPMWNPAKGDFDQ